MLLFGEPSGRRALALDCWVDDEALVREVFVCHRVASGQSVRLRYRDRAGFLSEDFDLEFGLVWLESREGDVHAPVEDVIDAPQEELALVASVRPPAPLQAQTGAGRDHRRTASGPCRRSRWDRCHVGKRL